jgi:hypothetical protein
MKHELPAQEDQGARTGYTGCMPRPRRGTRSTMLLGALFLSGCAGLGQKGFVCPAQGGPPWRELSTPTFVVKTDLDAAEARALVTLLELQRDAIAAVLGLARDRASGQLEVVAFATEREFQEWGIVGSQVGFFYRDDYGRQRAVIGGRLDGETRRIMAHELAHFVSAHMVVRQPYWFSEGVAQYLETVSRSESRPRAGLPPDGFPQFLETRLLPSRSLLTWQGTEVPQEQAHASSWLLVHYLLDAHPLEFGAFRQRLARAEEPWAAWNATFPEWSLRVPGATKRLDAALKGYLRRNEFGTIEPIVAPAAVTISERALGPGDVHALRIQLASVFRRHRLRAEVQEALAEDPDHVEALREAASRTKGGGLALARRAVRAHPDDPGAWAFLGASLHGPAAAAEREASLRKASELAPNDSGYHAALAVELAATARLLEALTEARRAVWLAPWSSMALIILARMLEVDRHCPEAIATAWRAVGMLGDGSPLAAAQVAQEAGSLEARCRQGAP